MAEFMKRKIYVETSVISYLTACPSKTISWCRASARVGRNPRRALRRMFAVPVQCPSGIAPYDLTAKVARQSIDRAIEEDVPGF